MEKAKLIMMVGLPGSGKSYFAGSLAAKLDAKIVSSDDYRKKLFGNVEEQKRNEELYAWMEKDTINFLKEGQSVIYDATNLRYRNRKHLLWEIKSKTDCQTECKIIATPYEQCIKQNQERDRHVPEEVIKRMYKSFQTPLKSEGWDRITVEYPSNIDKNLIGKKPSDFVQEVRWYDQDNPHHVNTLGIHCSSLGEYMEQYEAYKGDNIDKVFLKEVGYIHDCGKPFTRSEDEEGIGHYYGHANVGAYDCLFYDFHQDERNHYSQEHLRLHASQLVCYHMDHYGIDKLEGKEKEKAFGRYQKKLGKKLYEEMEVLTEGDEYCCLNTVRGRNCITYGIDSLDKSKFEEVKNFGHLPVKPNGGFWTCRKDADFDWKDWCEGEEFCLEELDKSVEFSISKDANILTIETEDDIRKLPFITENGEEVRMTDDCCTAIPIYKNKEGKMFHSADKWVSIDFEKLIAQGIDGMEVIRNSDTYDGLFYAWDCDSICIFNPDIIEGEWVEEIEKREEAVITDEEEGLEEVI